jgi:hypothetical protein
MKSRTHRERGLSDGNEILWEVTLKLFAKDFKVDNVLCLIPGRALGESPFLDLIDAKKATYVDRDFADVVLPKRITPRQERANIFEFLKRKTEPFTLITLFGGDDIAYVNAREFAKDIFAKLTKKGVLIISPTPYQLMRCDIWEEAGFTVKKLDQIFAVLQKK